MLEEGYDLWSEFDDFGRAYSLAVSPSPRLPSHSQVCLEAGDEFDSLQAELRAIEQ
jgi:hypothetical protein